MRHNPSNPPSLDADEFFELVDAHLTSPMAALGFNRLIEDVNDNPQSRSSNAIGSSPSGSNNDQGAPFLWFRLGFEVDREEVRHLLDPEDPESVDEWWVNYEPATGLLELGDWKLVAGDSVDWDIWLDEGPCSPAEVGRRLEAVGRAVFAFVAQHGGYPVTP